MISESEAVFLNRCLREIPTNNRIEHIEFTEEQVLKLISDINLSESDLNRGWERFFNCRSKDIVEDGVSTGEKTEMYHLSPEVIATDWADEVDSQPWFSETRLEQVDDECWCLRAQSDGRGELTFRLFFNGRRVEEYSPDALKNNFAVWFVEPRHKPEERATFGWAEFLQDDFWENLQRDLLQIQEPRTVDICRLDSVAASDNMEGIEDAIRYKFGDLELKVEEDPEEDITEIEEYILGPILFGAKDDKDGSYLLVCECDRSPNQLHLHYVRDGKPAYLSNSSHSDEVREFTRNKVKRYNELSAKKKDVLPILKWSAALLGAIGVSQVVPLFTFFGVQPDSQLVTNSLIVVLMLFLVLGLSVFVYMLLPVIAFRRFGWTRDSGWLD